MALSLCSHKGMLSDIGDPAKWAISNSKVTEKSQSLGRKNNS